MLTFAHISDTHIHPDETYSMPYAEGYPTVGARQLIQAINALPFPLDFVLHTGDVAYDPDPDAYHTCADLFSTLKPPIYYLAGNHDDSSALQTILMKHEQVMPQLHYTVEVNGVQIALVDSNGPAQPPAGYMTKAQLNWLAEICAADDPRPLIIATHHNPQVGFIPWLDDYMSIQNSNDFHQAILPAKHRLRGVFFGHVHQNLDVYRDGILYASTVSSWSQFLAYPGLSQTTKDTGAERGFSVVTITQDQTFIRRYRF
ncbi:MAG: hypothetical protein CUN56_00810 [Phototrophicales bacterium]|nr:MAG: hypothetical protein CUN56_00810 [Phototrophicales bacterium]